MKFEEYQKEARKTNRIRCNDEHDSNLIGDIVPLLGLSGEAGELLTEYKKKLRDGDAHQTFPNRIKEELGDILWYMSNLADRFEISLEEIAKYNIQKTKKRFIDSCSFEDVNNLPRKQQFPKIFTVNFKEVTIEGIKKIRPTINGALLETKNFGDVLTDNAYEEDGYRFHDAMHLSFVAILGWSPVMRKLLKEAKMVQKRSNDIEDEVQDGGRAKVIDEGLVALIYYYAEEHNFLKGVDTIDYSFLRTIMGMTNKFEVNCRTAADWQKAIIDGFQIWNKLIENNGGKVTVDRTKKCITYERIMLN